VLAWSKEPERDDGLGDRGGGLSFDALRALQPRATRVPTEGMLGRTLLPTVIYDDNMAFLLSLRKCDLSARTRHTRVNMGIIMDAIDNGQVVSEYVTSANQVAGVLAASEDAERFERNRAVLLGM
jgi:hypothetical protein